MKAVLKLTWISCRAMILRFMEITVCTIIGSAALYPIINWQRAKEMSEGQNAVFMTSWLCGTYWALANYRGLHGPGVFEGGVMQSVAIHRTVGSVDKIASTCGGLICYGTSTGYLIGIIERNSALTTSGISVIAALIIGAFNGLVNGKG